MLDVAWCGSQSSVYLGLVFVSPEGESVSLSEWGRQLAICSKSPEGDTGILTQQLRLLRIYPKGRSKRVPGLTCRALFMR